ncbi:nucleotide-diphospho-sugar transferase [Fimicolochytrium jonesii]|uniref:nucleotide-diphospho-sugar transferase n=1 Tax=Fimicolochytrium jonesii TaxID=1396493 RepID=UPI0022FDE606|nr:nucleotide-diphospho-sugar transferase [Fimicolochytrium jonesii]KAI8825060.1 nucleotide-diphospho-sugar transferase [Fimicolochytrium jonesii]
MPAPLSSGGNGGGGGGSSYGYVTLLTSDSYLPGALVVASSLRATITRYPLYVLVPTNALAPSSIAALERAYDRVVPVPLLRSNESGNLQLLGRAELDVTFTKLHVFDPEVSGLDKVVFLDADVMVTRNLDRLFDYLTADVVFAAAPDIGWPDCFNSGVFAAVPRRDIFEGLVRTVAGSGSFDGGDQGLLNTYFSSWASGVPQPGGSQHRTARIPFTFNVTPTSFYSYLPALVHFFNDISAVHFIGQAKPWTLPKEGNDSVVGGKDGPMGQFLARWWNFYDAVKHVLNYGSQSVGTPATKYNNWTGSVKGGEGPSTTSRNQRSGQQSGGQSTDNVVEFSNYRVAWDEREASPVRRRFSLTQTPFVVTYRATSDEGYPVFFDTEQPSALSPESEPGRAQEISPVTAESTSPNRRRPSYIEFEREHSQHIPVSQSPPATDLGNYRVGWNVSELGKTAKLAETPHPQDSFNTHWRSETELTSTALPPLTSPPRGATTPSTPGGARGSPVKGLTSDDEDDDELLDDDRVWNDNDDDNEAFVSSLKTVRPRTASAGSSGGRKTPTVGQRIPHSNTGQRGDDGRPKTVGNTAPGALG